MPTAIQVLKQYWGYTSFRDPQEELIQCVIEGKNVCAFLPTGAGKSICFQVPALCKKGICIVISPLIALMEDQVKNLEQRGISATYLKGGMDFKEVNRILDNCTYGHIKFLYLSAERLQQEVVQERIREMDVNLFAVDEAHCISQWGHDFRPAYRKLEILRELKPNTPCIAVTATATREVQEDIIQLLDLKQPKIIKKSFKRDNIALHVQAIQDKHYQLLQLLKGNTQPSIVYVRSRSATKDLSLYLNQNGISSLAYNGGMNHHERSSILKDWLDEKSKVVVATNAFGMGIDKANVRQVIHFQLPESIESYFQEVGRCGRDGLPSKASVLYNENDIRRLKRQFVDVIPELPEVISIYIKLNSYFKIAYGEGQDQTFDFDLFRFCHRYDLNRQLVYQTLSLLERLGILTLQSTSRKDTSIQFICTQQQLFALMDSQPKYTEIIQSILRTYGGIFDNFTPIDLGMISHLSKTSRSEVFKSLQMLEQQSYIKANLYINELTITFLVPKENEKSILLHSKYIKAYKRHKYEKAKAVVNFVKNSGECRSIQIMQYFGEENVENCGRCSVCLGLEKVEEKKVNFQSVSEFILSKLAEKDQDARSLIAYQVFTKSEIISTLKKLLSLQKIKLNLKNEYQIHKK